jgi:hypothetical protein
MNHETKKRWIGEHQCFRRWSRWFVKLDYMVHVDVEVEFQEYSQDKMWRWRLRHDEAQPHDRKGVRGMGYFTHR